MQSCPPTSPRIAAVNLLLVLLTCGVAWFHWLPPSTRGKDAPESSFSAARALEHVKRIAVEPHPAGTEANRRVRDYLLEELERLGVEHLYLEEVHQRPGRMLVESVGCVLARIPGRGPDAVAFDAHYDSTPYGPGAADDGSGCASLLETIRALQQGPKPENDLIFCFANKEEESGGSGGVGVFMNHPWFGRVKAVVGLEARGNRGATLAFETGPDSGFAAHYLQQLEHPRANSLMPALYSLLPLDSDFTWYQEKGLEGVNLAFVDGVDVYHTMLDSPERLSLDSLQHQGEYTLGLARALGDSPLDPDGDSEATYFNLIGFGLVVYPAGWDLPLALSALVLSGFALLVGAKAGFITRASCWAGLKRALVGGGLGLMVNAGIAFLLLLLFRERLLYLNGVTCLAMGLVATATLLWALRGLTEQEWIGLLAVNVLVWSAGLLALHLIFPKASYALTWPLGFLGAGLLGVVSQRRCPLSVLATLSVLPGLALHWPLVVEIAAAFTALCMPLVLCLLLPLFLPLANNLAALSGSNQVRLAFALMAGGVSIVALACMTNSPSASRPALTVLSAVRDHMTNQSFYVSSDALLLKKEWEECNLRQLTQDDYPYRRVPVDLLGAERLKFEIVSDEVVEGRRHLSFWLESRLGAQELHLRLPPSVQVYSTVVSGLQVNPEPGPWFLHLESFPQHRVQVSLVVDPEVPLEFAVKEVAYRVLQAARFKPLPPTLITQSNKRLPGRGRLRSNRTYALDTIEL